MIYASCDRVVEILRDLGFKIRDKKRYVEAKKKEGHRVLHIYLYGRGQATFCEIHADFPVHFLFLGVDYEKKPEEFFRGVLAEELRRRGIEFRVLGGYSWFSRKNKAILRGFKPW